MLELRVPTDAAWVGVVLADFDAFLVDHTACEKKAFSTAISLVSRFPEQSELVTPLLEFATINFATQQEVVFHFTPGPEILLGSIAMGGVLGVLAGILPAVRAARITPSQAMRT